VKLLPQRHEGPKSTAANPRPRFDGIDILRGLSILAVILLHISLRLKSAGFSLKPLMPSWLFHLLFLNGSNGVTVFFAVSGFIITFTSLDRFGLLSRVRPTLFYRLRLARLAPLFLLLLTVLSLLHLLQAKGFTIAPEKATLPEALFAALTFHLNWFEAVHGYLPANWDVLWSLSVEETFYLFFPLVCVLLLRFGCGTALFIVLLLGFITAGPFSRALWTDGIWQEKSYLGNMDGIALGCLCALLTDRLRGFGEVWRARQSTRLIALGSAGAALMLLVALWPPWSWVQDIGRSGLDATALAVGTCLVMIATVLRGRGGARWTAPLRWLGRHSYEVYLTHEFVVVWGAALYVEVQRGPLLLWVAAMLLVAIVPGAIAARYFSEPLNTRLRPAIPGVEESAAEAAGVV
jgi:peptidoglycan/LPS O-acetylase OafA/YrhL